jgi:hypothetical protein
MWGRWSQRICILLAGILLSAIPSAAQVEVGDTSMSLTGDIGFNYNGNINQGISGHSLGFAGDANLNGSFYNPNFLNFNVQPYYDRIQTNSAYGALTNARGVNASMNLFSGSHFPGTVNYDMGVNNLGQFGFPGSDVGLTQKGNFHGFGVSWSELLPNLPTLTASYSIGGSTSSIYGSQEENKQNDHTLSLISSYHIAGFRLGGGYIRRNLDSNFSEILDGLVEPTVTSTDTNNYEFNAQHSFPMSGSYSFAWNRTSYSYSDHDSRIANDSGTSDTLNGNLTFLPVRKLTMSFNGAYYDSLLGALPEPVVNGTTVLASSSVGTFRSVLAAGDANYQLIPSLNLHALVNHQHQAFLGQTYDATQFGGSVNYNLNKKLLGSLTFSFALFDTMNEKGNAGLGFTGNVNFDRKIEGWDVNANFSYSQNVQTLFLTYTTSSMGYVTNARRRLANRTFFMAGFSGSHSGITADSGSSSSAERVSSTLIYRLYSVSGFYSKSDGTAAFTANGLVAIPTNLPPGVLAPGTAIVYGAKAYGFNLSLVPVRRLTITAGYSESNGFTEDPLLRTQVGTQLYNVVSQYRLRKIYVNSGFTRLRQSVGLPGMSPVHVTSYYIGISRWFNFF